MNILLAGGAGYIGSHTAVELLNAGHDLVIVDNYSNSSPDILKKIEKITSKKFMSYEADIRNKIAMQQIFYQNNIDCVIHFAGLKAVGESILQPIKYYRNNIDTTLTLLECMQEANVKQLVFSSSATVYGEDNIMPCIETMQRGKCTNPYGWTKVMVEQILEDTARADSEMAIVLLRYFNPVGAHCSGLIGENPKGVPNNLMPYVTQVAIGIRDHLTIFGDDYDTADGTCRRDFIHVMDLAHAHLKAIQYTDIHKGIEIFNIGTGTPYSVLELVNTFQSATGIKIKYEIGARRDGDLAECWANTDKAAKVLGWKSKCGLEDMCRDAWRWEMNMK